jgi:hypothetical protein
MKNQFKALAGSIYNFNDDLFEQIFSENINIIDKIIKDFTNDIISSRNGYPIQSPSQTPFAEDLIHQVFRRYENHHVKLKAKTPFVCLTHDVDYIYPTNRQNIKRLLGRFDFNLNFSRTAYLESLEKYLELDSDYGKSTLFIAQPSRKMSGLKRFKQWIIDPSYASTDFEFIKLRDLVNKYDVDVGVHGSFYSLEYKFILNEVTNLQASIGKEVRLSRQHWLNLGGLQDLSTLSTAGINIDSSLGWNGFLGFRCGMARPYKIVLSEDFSIWEVPMLLMDGVLFDELRLNEKEVIATAIRILDEVYERGGGTTINWHERTFAKDYGWGNAYKEILAYARNKGFKFLSLTEAVELYE